jgi:hypothetical protein
MKFLADIDILWSFESAEGEEYDDLVSVHGSADDVVDRLITLNPVMKELMSAARPDLGEYTESPSGGWSLNDSEYWRKYIRDRVLRAIGIHELGEEVRRRMEPDSPDLAADQFHQWVWEAAAPMWHAGSTQEAVHAAARSVNARMQQKRGHHDKSDTARAVSSSAWIHLCPDGRAFGSPDTRVQTPHGEVGSKARWTSARVALRPYATLPLTNMDLISPSRWHWSSSQPSAC